MVPGTGFITHLWGPPSASAKASADRRSLWRRRSGGPIQLKPDPTAEQGYTFIELLVVSTIILILASAIMPLARVTSTRTREAELRRGLRDIRTAIDKFKDAADAGQIGSLDLKPGGEGYPADLELLVDGVSAVNDQTGRKLKFLRRVPIDPMTRSTEWGMRSYQDEADSTRWGGQNVFDVYTTFDGTALDGTRYKDW